MTNEDALRADKRSFGIDTAQAAEGGKVLSSSVSAYHWIKRNIITSAFGPGTKLDERHLAAEFGCSRTPVREALHKLCSEGFVEIVPRRGVEVCALTLPDLKSIYDIVTALETEAVALLAAQRLDSEALQPLHDALRGMEAAVQVDRPNDWTQLDEDFHRLLLTMCGNKRLADLGVLYRELSQRAHFIADRARAAESQLRSIKTHRELVDLIQAGDVEGARANHYAQRILGSAKLLEALQKLGVTLL